MLCGPHTMQNKYGLWTEIMHYALLYNIIHIWRKLAYKIMCNFTEKMREIIFYRAEMRELSENARVSREMCWNLACL